MKKAKQKFIIFISLFFVFFLSIHTARLAYYSKPRMNIIEKEISIDNYDAKYVHKLYFVEDREYFQKLKIEEVLQRSGLSIKAMKRDTLYNAMWYRERNKQR